LLNPTRAVAKGKRTSEGGLHDIQGCVGKRFLRKEDGPSKRAGGLLEGKKESQKQPKEELSKPSLEYGLKEKKKKTTRGSSNEEVPGEKNKQLTACR